MTETIVRSCDGNGQMPGTPERAPLPAEPGTYEHLLGEPGRPDGPAPPRCPYGRSYSKFTGEYSINLGWGAFGEIMELAVALLEHVEPWADDKTLDMFDGLLEHIAGLRKWTGVPG